MKVKKVWRRIVILILVFIAAAGGFVFLSGRQERSEQTKSEGMPQATLPVLYTEWNGRMMNVLHGYVEPMEAAYVRDTITPVAAGRSLTLQVCTYGQTVTGGTISVYSLDGSRFLEEQEIAFTEKSGDFSVELQLTALLDTGTEYRLQVELSTEKREKIYYYTRIISEENLHLTELLQFAQNFSDASLDKEAAKEAIAPYLLPSDAQTNDSFAYANRNSGFATITWEDLSMRRVQDPVWHITEITQTQVSVTVNSVLECVDSYGVMRRFDVEEFFCVRWRDGKQYLLAYERNAEQIFTGNSNCLVNGNIWFGIMGSDAVEVVSDKSGDTVCFRCGEELWGYSRSKNEMIRLFGWKERTADLRNDYDQHGIHIVRLDEDGNVYFMVYGYQNRGNHEGTVGTCFYRYDAKKGTTRELYYIPSNVSYQILKEYAGKLCYVNDDNLCYLLYGNGIYSIDLDGSECLEIVRSVRPDSYAISADGSVIMWQEGNEDSVSDVIHLLNMNTGQLTELRADEGEYLSAVGFLQNDLVYGRGRVEDIVVEAGVQTVFPLYSVEIMEMENQTIEETYRFDGIYVTGVTLETARVRMERMQRTADGTLEPIGEDALILNDAAETAEAARKSTVDARMRRCWYLDIGSKKDADTMQFSMVTPQLETAKTDRSIDMPSGHPSEDSAYYVYGYGKLLGIHGSLREAIREAYDAMGSVLTGEMENCWNRDSRALAKEIAIGQHEAVPEEKTLAEAIRIVLLQEGETSPDCERQLANGASPLEVMGQAAENGVENLYGCTLSQILYYLNQGQPVLAVTGDSTGVVIVGYTTTAVRIYDPATASVSEWNMEAAEDYFAETGNRFAAVRKK